MSRNHSAQPDRPDTMPRTVKSSRMTRQEVLWAFIFLLPNFVLVLIFVFLPAVGGLGLAFTQWDVFSPPRFIALDNFRILLADSNFWLALRNTIVFTAITVPCSLAGSLALAILLNSKLPGTIAFRTIFFIPVVMSGVLVSLTWRWLFNADYGLINYFLANLGIQGPNWLQDPRWALLSICIVAIWQNLGFNMVIFLAALQSVPTVFYEAARLDGADKWQQFRHITLPMISPATFFASILLLITSLQVFDLVFIMTGGGPGRSTTVMVQYIYENAFQYFEMGYAAATAMSFFLLILVFTLVQWRLRKRWVYGES